MLSSDLPSSNTVTLTFGTLEEMEDQIIAALEKRGVGNQAEMAKLLGISRTTLWKRVNRNNR